MRNAAVIDVRKRSTHNSIQHNNQLKSTGQFLSDYQLVRSVVEAFRLLN
jgi:hypothetical protein